MNRIDRLSAILIMLQSSNNINTKQIAERFNLSTRTIYRDIRALEEAGIPIAGGASEGYSLVEGFKLPPLMFTKEEAFAFIAAEKLVEKFSDSGLKESYNRGIEKIKAVMRLAEIEIAENMGDKIRSFNPSVLAPADSTNRLYELMENITKKRRIEINYFSYSSHKHSVRKIDPIGLFFSLTNWYLIAYCHTKKDYRTFKVGRIKSIAPTDLEFSLNHPPLDSFLKQVGQQEELQKIIIEVDKADFSLIDENRYYQGLVAEIDRENSVELHFMVFSTNRFVRWYLSYIDIAKIKYPDTLNNRVKEILQKANV